MKIKSKSLYPLDTENLLLLNFPPDKNPLSDDGTNHPTERDCSIQVIAVCELYLIQIILSYFGAIED